MNEQFRIAHKLGLMFLHDTPLPKDVKAWTISQLHAKSPALGIKKIQISTKPDPKPDPKPDTKPDPKPDPEPDP